MPNTLNKKGNELVMIKEQLIKGEIKLEVLEILKRNYSHRINKILLNNEVSIEKFIEELKNEPYYCLSRKELIILKNENIAKLYDEELSKSFNKFTVKVIQDKLYIAKHFRLNKTYYKAFLGKEVGSSRGELEAYKDFVRSRLSVVLRTMKRNISQEGMFPTYKTIKYEQYKPIYVSTYLNDNIATISLCIDLNKKSSLDINLKVISKFLTFVNSDIEKYMNYNLYN